MASLCSALMLIHPCASSLLLLPSTATPSHSQRRHHAVAVATDTLCLRALRAPCPAPTPSRSSPLALISPRAHPPSRSSPSHSQRRHHAVAVAGDALDLRALHASRPPHPALPPLRLTLL
ncbi:unnamed protein product [Closterium sp. NIES-54]